MIQMIMCHRDRGKGIFSPNTVSQMDGQMASHADSRPTACEKYSDKFLLRCGLERKSCLALGSEGAQLWLI